MMNSDYIVGLSKTFEERYGVKFQGMSDGAVTDSRERLIQFKTNVDVAMSVLNRNGLGDWLADRLVAQGDAVTASKTPAAHLDVTRDPFHRRASARRESSDRAAESHGQERHFRQGKGSHDLAVQESRRSLSGRPPRHFWKSSSGWNLRHQNNRMLSVAADLSESVNLEHGSAAGAHYDPDTNPLGHTPEGRDPGSRQCVDRDWSRQSKRIRRPGPVRRRMGIQRYLRGVHAADVPPGARLEPAESGQQVSHRRPPHPGGSFRPRDRRRCAHAFRHLLAAGVEAVSTRADHQSELLGLQRRRTRILRRCGDCRTQQEGGNYHD